jgi:hypothetical protein
MGLHEDDAVKAIELATVEDPLDRTDRLSWRVIERDDHIYPKSNDYKPWRINLWIKNGIVERASAG